MHRHNRLMVLAIICNAHIFSRLGSSTMTRASSLYIMLQAYGVKRS